MIWLEPFDVMICCYSTRDLKSQCNNSIHWIDQISIHPKCGIHACYNFTNCCQDCYNSNYLNTKFDLNNTATHIWRLSNVKTLTLSKSKCSLCCIEISIVILILNYWNYIFRRITLSGSRTLITSSTSTKLMVFQSFGFLFRILFLISDFCVWISFNFTGMFDCFLINLAYHFVQCMIYLF